MWWALRCCWAPPIWDQAPLTPLRAGRRRWGGPEPPTSPIQAVPLPKRGANTLLWDCSTLEATGRAGPLFLGWIVLGPRCCSPPILPTPPSCIECSQEGAVPISPNLFNPALEFTNSCEGREHSHCGETSSPSGWGRRRPTGRTTHGRRQWKTAGSRPVLRSGQCQAPSQHGRYRAALLTSAQHRAVSRNGGLNTMGAPPTFVLRFGEAAMPW